MELLPSKAGGGAEFHPIPSQDRTGQKLKLKAKSHFSGKELEHA